MVAMLARIKLLKDKAGEGDCDSGDNRKNIDWKDT
jgi:hypothetical protein